MKMLTQVMLPLLMVLLMLGAAVFLLSDNSANAKPDTQQPAPLLAQAEGEPAVVTVEVPVTVEVTRVVTVVVTPTFTPVPPTATRVPPELLIDDDPYLGNADAPIKIVEFSDFQCGYCARFADQVLDPLMERYGEHVQFVYRDFPILGDASVYAALAGQCVTELGTQEDFWYFHDSIFANAVSEERQPLSVEFLQSIVEQRDLDVDEWAACIDSEEAFQEIAADYNVGAGQGVSGTPAFFVNEVYVSGAQPLDVFIQIIDEQLLALGIEPPEGD